MKNNKLKKKIIFHHVEHKICLFLLDPISVFFISLAKITLNNTRLLIFMYFYEFHEHTNTHTLCKEPTNQRLMFTFN